MLIDSDTNKCFDKDIISICTSTKTGTSISTKTSLTSTKTSTGIDNFKNDQQVHPPTVTSAAALVPLRDHPNAAPTLLMPLSHSRQAAPTPPHAAPALQQRHHNATTTPCTPAECLLHATLTSPSVLPDCRRKAALPLHTVPTHPSPIPLRHPHRTHTAATTPPCWPRAALTQLHAALTPPPRRCTPPSRSPLATHPQAHPASCEAPLIHAWGPG